MPAISAAGSPQMAPSSSAAPLIAGNTGTAGASSMSATTSMSSTSSVYSSVNTMLGSIDSGLAGNDTLKMAIALLILKSMEGGKESGGGDGKDLLGALAGMMGGAGGAGGAGGSSSFMMMMQSSQSSISVEQTVSTSHVQNAYAGVNAAAQSGAGLSATA
jgi:hypothetical protein